ncbi:MAG: OmpA family protein [Bacteroidia bacterium]|nr:OmpA family protein [Bacteroidia bacterium]MCX7651539.1 OmpA family protein [Bacteroidia bacterium]MDW8416265.1 OmpA family protein [Bacteroidia bacterium]
MSWLGLLGSLLWAQTILRQKCYGGTMADVMVRAYQDAGGYWLFGHTRSKDGLLKRKAFDADFWVVRTDRMGEVLWQSTYGAEGDEELNDVLRLSDGGWLLVGWTDSKSLSHGKKDAFIIRTDALGKPLWQKAVGGIGNDMAFGAGIHPDGTLWVLGQIGSYDSVLHPKPYGGVDAWLLRFSSQGELIGHATFGGSENDYLRLCIPLSPDTVWLIGASDSPDGHIQNPLGRTDIWLVEVDKSGHFRRSWNFGGADFEEPYSYVCSPTGEIWVAGTSFSAGAASYGRADGCIWRIDITGVAELVWSGGGSGDEGLNFLSYTSSGDWLIAGMSSSRNGLIPHLAGLYDAWALRWERQRDSLVFCYTFGGKDVDSWVALFPAEEGAYVGCGTTASPGDQLGIRTFGNADFWLVWWSPDSVSPTFPVINAPTVITGYLLTEVKGTPGKILFRNQAGRVVDSVSISSSGLFRWEVPDSIGSEVWLSIYAVGHMWKDVSIRLRRNRENRVDIYLEKLRPNLRLPLFNITFEKGSAKLLPEAMPQLEALYRFLVENPAPRIEIAGHTDGTSLAESEIQLSRGRAQAVKEYLVSRGLPKDRFTIVGYGKSRPIADNATPEGQRRNRRVEIRIVN